MTIPWKEGTRGFIFFFFSLWDWNESEADEQEEDDDEHGKTEVHAFFGRGQV